MKPTVSVVVTCYNYGKYVVGCLESLQNQTFSDFEVIIVNDGSTDNSEEQIHCFLQDNRFRYIKQKNSGQASAKNRGIRESRGEFIAFLDADDLWLPGKLEKQINLFSKREVGVVYSGVAHIDTKGIALSMDSPGKHLQPRRGKVAKYLIYDNFVPFSSAIVRRVCFDSLGKFDESITMGIDWDLWLRFSTKYQFDFCEKIYLLYRVGHSGQMSKNVLERIQCADRIVAKFKKNFPCAVSSVIMKDADYYSNCLRGYALRKYGMKFPVKYYSRAIALFPLRKKAYIGFLKAPLRAIFGR